MTDSSKIQLLPAALQLPESVLRTGFTPNADDRLGSGQAIASTGTVAEHKFHSVSAHDFPDVVVENSCGSDFNCSVNFVFTSGVNRKFSRCA